MNLQCDQFPADYERKRSLVNTRLLALVLSSFLSACAHPDSGPKDSNSVAQEHPEHKQAKPQIVISGDDRLRDDEFDELNQALQHGHQSTRDRIASEVFQGQRESALRRRWRGLDFEIDILELELETLHQSIEQARSDAERKVLQARGRRLRSRIRSFRLERERLGVELGEITPQFGRISEGE